MAAHLQQKDKISISSMKLLSSFNNIKEVNEW